MTGCVKSQLISVLIFLKFANLSSSILPLAAAAQYREPPLQTFVCFLIQTDIYVNFLKNFWRVKAKPDCCPVCALTSVTGSMKVRLRFFFSARRAAAAAARGQAGPGRKGFMY